MILMDVRVIGSNKPGFVLPVEEAKLFAGHSANVCYMKEDFDTILAEPSERTLKRFEGNVKSGHHSVAGHLSWNLLLTGVPKIVAMVLNNEKDYCTSEKSARYTKMKIEGEEKRLYFKWLALFIEMIRGEYPQLANEVAEKLAQENARYFISVFTPSTTMVYTVDFRQGNYLIGFLEDAAEQETDDPFMKRLQPLLLETAQLFKSVFNCEGLRDNKGRKLSLFADEYAEEYFHRGYSVNYVGSFAQLAQAQRHRTIWYEMIVPKLFGADFFVPPIIKSYPGMVDNWLADMESVKENFPQGMLVHINESATRTELFLDKCQERLCGAAQLEICQQTQKTYERYYAATMNNEPVHKLLEEHRGQTKCQYGFQPCLNPCPLGQARAFTRKI